MVDYRFLRVGIDGNALVKIYNDFWHYDPFQSHHDTNVKYVRCLRNLIEKL